MYVVLCRIKSPSNPKIRVVSYNNKPSAPCHGVLSSLTRVLRFDCIMSSFIFDLVYRRYPAFRITYPMQYSMVAGYKLWRTRGKQCKQCKQYSPALLMPPSKYHQHSSSLPADASAKSRQEGKEGTKTRRHEGKRVRLC